MKTNVGIKGYGVYIPQKRIKTDVIVRAREDGRKDLQEFLDKVRDGLLLRNKSIADFSEDVTTMATEATENALIMSEVNPKDIGTAVLGSESKPYAVGLSARHAASFVGIGNEVFVSDLEGACNAAMQGMSFVKNQIESNDINYGLVIGSDIAQAPPGDPLEYACGSGAAAFILGLDHTIANIIDMVPYSSLYMDFWRRDGVHVPSHFGKTTVDAYITHVVGAIKNLLKRYQDLKLRDFDAITFHQPSGYLPLKTCRTLLEPNEKIFGHDIASRIKLTKDDIEVKVKPWLKVLDIGNTYAASTPISLASILDEAKPGQKVLAVSYGSGAYSIATWLEITKNIVKTRKRTPTVNDYLKRKQEIELHTYMDHIKERLTYRKRLFSNSRIIGNIVGKGDSIEVQFCNGCKRIFYPPRSHCLQWDCDGDLQMRQFPKIGKIMNVKKLTFNQRNISTYEIYQKGKVLLVDCTEELQDGSQVELVIRRLEYEGKEGIIQYGPSYRPLFRYNRNNF